MDFGAPLGHQQKLSKETPKTLRKRHQRIMEEVNFEMIAKLKRTGWNTNHSGSASYDCLLVL